MLFRHGAARAASALARQIPGLGRRLPPPPSGPRRLRTLLETLGGTFVKLGQVLTLQPDVLPQAYRDELFDLMDRMPPFEFDAVERLFRDELGRSTGEIFDSFDEAPFACASIAQVHAARLGGRTLAVKVQRPGAGAEFGGDIALMRFTVRWIRRLRLRPLDWLARILEEFTSWTGEELDFRAEARFMDRLEVESRDRERARVPAVEWSLTTARILTAELLEGPTLLQYLRSLEQPDTDLVERLAGLGFDPARFAENALHNFFHDVFHRGLFHADLHPANLLILPDNAVGYVDFGISGVVSEFARYHLVASILALTRGDTGRACDHVMAICETGPDTDPSGFRHAFEVAGDTWFRRRPGGGRPQKRKSYSEIMLDVLRLSRTFRVFPHTEALRYMRSVITLDGLIERVASNVDRDRTLERESASLLESTALSAPLSFDRWLNWLSVAARLLRDGPARVDRALAHLERRLSSGASAEPRPRGLGGSRSALRLAAVAGLMGLLILVPSEPARFGFNLFTAELTIIAGALGLLARELLRWDTPRP